jgi:peptidoglycan/LPS O-acetylase OafA/YrhL
MNRRHIDLLDSFRCLACVSVMFYHFVFRWNTLLPQYDGFGSLFSQGYWGVELFFVISGFVISYTLENTEGPLVFFKHRFIRLFPPLLLCTFITFAVAACLDKDGVFSYAHDPKNLLPSLTLITPKLWTRLTHLPFYWINGSYWSLWDEVQFYVLAALLYFTGKKNFLRNMLLAGLALTLLKFLPDHLLASPWRLRSLPGLTTPLKRLLQLNSIFHLVYTILWFSLGTAFYRLYCGFRWQEHRWLTASFLLILGLLCRDPSGHRQWAMVLFILLLFGLLIYKRKWLSFLDIPLFRRIGIISYSIYLLHEVIGVLLLIRLGPVFGRSPLLPLMLVVLFILFAELLYRIYEKPVTRKLKKMLLRRNDAISTIPSG